MKENFWITQAEAARILHVSPVRVRQLVRAGKLPFRQDSDRIWLDRDTVVARLRKMAERKSADPPDYVGLENAEASDHMMIAPEDTYCQKDLSAVQTFHERNGLAVGTGTRQDLLLRLALLQEELGELASVVTKAPIGPQHGFLEPDWLHLQEKWTDVWSLLLGWAVEMGWSESDINAMFDRVHDKTMSRPLRHTVLASPVGAQTSKD